MNSSDEFNTLQTAKFLADFKSAMGINTSVAKEYKELEEFDVDQYLSEYKTSKSQLKNQKE